MPETAPINPLGQPFIELTEVDSSNNYAMQQVKEGRAGHGSAFFAFNQFQGKGRRSKNWQSAPGENIILSVIIDTIAFAGSPPFLLSMAMACGVHQFLFSLTEKNFLIKWPNDIYFNDRKAAGILIENIYRGSTWQWAIVGIGINTNQEQFDPELANPVSLKQITSKRYQPEKAARTLCNFLETAYRQSLSNPEEIIHLYNLFLYKKNEIARFKKNGTTIECQVDSVDKFGQLKIIHPLLDHLQIDEVKWLIQH